ncbi:MAG: MBL fold metallo-hydrolase [Thermodesulfobacteriota bacterium]
MWIKCWGSRGSVPVSGPEYLKYGGDTTCLEIRTKSGHILIVDLGTGIRRLGNSLIDADRYEYHFLLTHGHWDHIIGFPFFKPNLYRKSHYLMHSGPFHKDYFRRMLSKVLSPPNFPLRCSDIVAKMIFIKDPPGQFEIGSLSIIPLPLSHPNTGSGYKFVEDGKSFIFLTDNELGYVHPGGLPFKDYLQFSRHADFLIHDAEYTPEEYETTRRWGHSSYMDVLGLATQANVKTLGLFHMNQERTDRQMDEILEDCRRTVSGNGQNLECVAVGADMVFEV